jgi:hypothetical protein
MEQRNQSAPLTIITIQLLVVIRQVILQGNVDDKS